MKIVLFAAGVLLLALSGGPQAAVMVAVAQDPPLRVFIRSGPKSHGPGAHDYPRFLADWLPLLNARGVRAAGGERFPTRAELDQTDVLVLHAQEAGTVTDPGDRANLMSFLARGGGLVVIHAAAVSKDPDWFKGIVGGSWREGMTRWLEGPMHLYFTDRVHPITSGVSNWSMDDEIYYDMDLAPDVQVLAAAYTPKAAGARDANAQKRAEALTGGGKQVSVYDIQPQMWTYERLAEGGSTPYRAFVSIPGHLYANFSRPNYRAVILRGLAWAGRRANVDSFLVGDERGDALRYVDGGPTHPDRAAALIEVHPEFDLSLVAAEPLIHKAMNLDWDERGRMWVSETPEYPNGRRPLNAVSWRDSGSLRPPQASRDPEDTISILSDTNGDGRMDRKHVFADKLELVTGFVLHRSGVIAATAPDIWYLEDTNGDEVADRRTKLYTGLGTADTHAVVNNLRWGLDGWIYATHGYSTAVVTSPDGKTTFGRDGSGVVRFRPDGSAFEQYSSRGGNTWGLDITWDGQVFWTQPTSGTVLFHTVLPESVLAKGRIPNTSSAKGLITGQTTYPLMTWPEQAYVQIDQVGRFTAAAGCAIYDGGAWPDRWRFAYFTGEPTLNLVHSQFVKPDGVSYTTMKEAGREATEFMRSRDLWFRPIETRVGPDGALYVIDFYNQAVIHNDTRGPVHNPANAAVRPDRDHYFGRIWRVQHKQARRLDAPALDRRDLTGLIDVMKTNPNAHVKQTAWRLAMENFAGDPRLDGVRRPMGSAPLALYERSRQARTVAERAAVLVAFSTATDDWTRSALIAAASEQAPAYVTQALSAPRPDALVDFVAGVLPAALPTAAESLLIAAASAPPAAAPLAAAVLRGVGQVDPPAALTAAARQALQSLLSHPATTAAVLPVAVRWDRNGSLAAATEARGRALVTELRGAALTVDRRVELAASLLAVPAHRAETLSIVAPMLVDAGLAPPLRERLVVSVGDAAGADADAVLIETLALTASTPVFNQLLRRPDSALALIAALKRGAITAAALEPAAVQRLRNHPNKQVASEATAYLDSVAASARARSEVIAALLPAVEQPGNATRGRDLFAAACASCHKLGSLGATEVGPPLDGMGAHPRSELLTHILDPNRQVDPSFWQVNVTTRRGEAMAGVVASENASTLTLRNPSGSVEIAKADIVSRETTRLSLMPEGLDALGAEALRDILTFMAGAAPASSGPQGAVAGPKEGGRGDAPLPVARPIVWAPGRTKVLIIGGGSSHNFSASFEATDRATLEAAGFSVNYTEDRDQAAAEIGGADVAIISVNRQFFDTPAYRTALASFAAAGKGIVMLHPGTWYGYAQWPDLNATIVGGGARGHDRIGRFTVTVVQPAHPILAGVPPAFDVEDELYWFNAEPDKTPPGTAPIEVLAETSPSARYKQPHPAVWITRHPRARIVGITIGHDERVHTLDAYKRLLANAVRWAAASP
jgi:putative membrane-bound dehydrogenase-like protein